MHIICICIYALQKDRKFQTPYFGFKDLILNTGFVKKPIMGSHKLVDH